MSIVGEILFGAVIGVGIGGALRMFRGGAVFNPAKNMPNECKTIKDANFKVAFETDFNEGETVDFMNGKRGL